MNPVHAAAEKNISTAAAGRDFLEYLRFTLPFSKHQNPIQP
jgi:hypothetical protein